MNGNNGDLVKLRQKIKTADHSERLVLFMEQPLNIQAQLISGMRPHLKKVLLESQTDEQLLKLFRFLAPDTITDLLQLIDKNRQKKVLDLLEQDMKDKVEFLLKFNPKSAAGIMSLDYIETKIGTSSNEIAKLVKVHDERTGKVPLVLVIDGTSVLGEFPWYYLAMPEINKIEQKHVKKVPTIKYDAPKEEVIAMFKAHRHNKVVVLDEDDSILGIIYSDDAISLIDENAKEGVYNFAGVHREEDVLDLFLTKVKHRWKWLLINLLTASLGAFVVSQFDATIAKYVILAAYMPIIAGMGGNAGTQAMAVMVRGLTLKEVEWKNARYVIFNEVITGLINGLIVGTVLGIVSFFLNQNPMLGVILGVSLVVNLMVACLMGSLMPIVMKAFGKDPATASSIFITATTDVCGFLIFLGMATLLL